MAYPVVVSSRIEKVHDDDNNTRPDKNTGDVKYKGEGIDESNESNGECAINNMSLRTSSPEIAFASRFSEVVEQSLIKNQ